MSQLILFPPKNEFVAFYVSRVVIRFPHSYRSLTVLWDCVYAFISSNVPAAKVAAPRSPGWPFQYIILFHRSQ